MGKIKKIFKWAFILTLIFLIGGIGGVIIDHSVLPKLTSYDYFSKLNFIQKANENVTIINKTEQVTIMEQNSINEIASRAATATVKVVSYSDSNELSGGEKNIKSGLGIIVASDGLIVTHRRVILEKEASYKIWTFNENEYEAKLLNIDEFTDLAYFKIDASNLPVISFANSDDFESGKKIIAIGNYFDEYQNIFSAGFLSGFNRTFNLSGKTVSSSEKLEGVFETSFANQPEYLGGPIVSYSGELVGIIGSIAIDNQDKYFQIPSNSVKESLNLAIGNKLEERASLGVYYCALTKICAEKEKVNRDRGALIYAPSGRQGLAVMDNSSAEKAGIKINDIIIAIDKKEVNLDNPLSNLVSHYKKGEQAELLIIRNGEEIKLKVDF